MVTLTGIQQKTVFLTTYHSFIFHPVLVAETIDPLFILQCGCPLPFRWVGWLVGWVGAAHYFVGWQEARARHGSSCAVVLSTILVAVSQNCVVGGNPPMACLLFAGQKVSGKAPKSVGFTQPPKDLGNFYFYF
jgi:hypothetical protein